MVVDGKGEEASGCVGELSASVAMTEGVPRVVECVLEKARLGAVGLGSVIEMDSVSTSANPFHLPARRKTDREKGRRKKTVFASNI